MTGTVLKGIGGFYYVLGKDDAVYTLHAQSKLRSKRLKPMVGDRVDFEPGTLNEDDGWLKAILPRKNELIRPPVCNIDCLVITFSASVPEADLLLTDRMLIAARQEHIEPMIAVNKCETAPETANALLKQYDSCGAKLFKVSAADGEGIKELRQALYGKVHAFAGQSGVGKSSLINALYGTDFEVGSISNRIGRGRHTTRSCSLLPVNGGAVLDTPGFSLLEAELTEPQQLQEAYPEFTPFRDRCRFQPCCHDTAPDCAIKERIIAGQIDPYRYERYLLLLNEMRERWAKRYD